MENCVWKEECMRKVGIADLTIQSSFSQLFEKELGRKMEGNKLECTILPSKVHNWRFLNGKLWQEKDMRKAGIKLWKEHGMRKAGIHDLTIQSSQLQIFEGKSVKGKGNEKSRNLRLRSYHPKFIFCSCLKRKGKKNTFWASWSRFWNILSRGSEYIV